MNIKSDSRPQASNIAWQIWDHWFFSGLTVRRAAARCPGIPVGRSGPAILSKQKTVFVVDDDLGMLRGVKRLLNAHGYDSVLFSSAEAFQKHDDFKQAICVVLDINLSDRSGIDVNRRLKASGVSLPVIFVTGRDNPATRVAAMASGCIAYLTKPFVAKSLMEPIERVAANVA
jgi:FixJ family two-component response regulator